MSATTSTPLPRRAAFATLTVAALLLSGCAAVPADADGTSARVQDGVLRAGITHNPPWTDTSTSGGPSGSEVRLVAGLAEQLDASIEWTVGAEAPLTEALHRGDLDLVIGGFTDDTPWTDKAAMTAPYIEERHSDGTTRKHVLLTRAGENRFLVTVETFLQAHRSAE